jgi:imidazoleglycerol-phosphate dehydratase/histidinol-phosphatase
MKRALFIDRDGTIIEEPSDEQVDTVDKFRFLPQVISSLSFLRSKTDYEFVMVTNQDGLGTPANPQEVFDEFQNLMLHTLSTEGVTFDDILIDKSYPEDNLPTRKPGIGMMGKYLTGEYDLQHSYVIGDRATDAQLAKNMGCKAVILKSRFTENLDEPHVVLVDSWQQATELIYAGERVAEMHRQTKETDVYVRMNLDGHGKGRHVG